MRRKPVYQVLDGVELSARIQAKGFISFREFMVIGAWKSARAVALMTANAEDTVATRSRKALELYSSSDLQGSVIELKRLKGVGVAMASAILAVSFWPNVPIIDKWACLAVGWPPSAASSVEVFVKYVGIVEKAVEDADVRAVVLNANAHRLDTVLMELGMRTAHHRDLLPEHEAMREYLSRCCRAAGTADALPA